MYRFLPPSPSRMIFRSITTPVMRSKFLVPICSSLPISPTPLESPLGHPVDRFLPYSERAVESRLFVQPCTLLFLKVFLLDFHWFCSVFADGSPSPTFILICGGLLILPACLFFSGWKRLRFGHLPFAPFRKLSVITLCGVSSVRREHPLV